MGPVVESLWRDERYELLPPPNADLDEAALNTVGYVVSRYGAFTGRDLEVTTHGESPWALANAARLPRDRAPIRLDWIYDYFTTDGAADDGADDAPPDTAAMSAWLRETGHGGDSADPLVDDLDRLREWATRER
jgi:hypothetical protein